MNMEETIYKRQSIRAYRQSEVDEETIEEIRKFIQQTKALNENISWDYDIVTADKIKTILPWRAPHYLLMFSEEKENYRKNIGFIFQQVDLYLQSKGIGTCWLGMASPNRKYQNENKKHAFIISMSFGYPEKELYRKKEEFKRKKLEQITDKMDEKLEPAQYAPSATNSQPWYFTHNNDGTYNIYRKKLGFLKRKTIGKWNPIDIGIALAHLYITNRESFKYYVQDEHEDLKDYEYEGSFKI
ncbi:MAG: hypothetical protein BZ138_01115 [Methanosphaera sp. rholeuAM270]|nr:MAG: hypothetical protein BZ138_01115 [Methanosphaera sp. rholeuAM270]